MPSDQIHEWIASTHSVCTHAGVRSWLQVLQAAFERQIAGLNHPGLIGATNTWVCQHPAMVHALEPIYPAGFEPVLLVQEMPRLPGSTLDTYVNQVRIMSFEQCLCSEVRPCQRWCAIGCDIAAATQLSRRLRRQLLFLPVPGAWAVLHAGA